jgi:predicted Zn-ribbon and HTH transcriptional regulator
MLEVADIFRLHGESFRAHHPLEPWQRKAMADIEHCRTAHLGGHLERCDRCGHEHYSYHSCRNRHCPKCHGEQTETWLQKQQARLLPTAYYLLTFTLPASLRPMARSHPRAIYRLLFQAAVASLQKLARDPRWVGGILPILAVDGLPVGDGQMGPVTRAIDRAYHDLVRGLDEQHAEWRTPVWA